MQIYLLLTERCNLNCTMCIRGRQTGSDMDFDQLRHLAHSGMFSGHDVVLTGGEPALYPHFREAVALICRHAKTGTVTSNGTLDLCLDEGFGQSGNLLFQISLDGSEAAHDAIRGPGAFRAAMETLRRLDQRGYRYSVATVASRKNVQSMMELSDTLAGLPGLQHWKVSYEMPFGSCGFRDMMTASEWNSFVEDLLSAARVRLIIKKLFPFELYDKAALKPEQTGRRFNCGCGRDKLYVYPDFNVYPCTCLTDFCIGNLLEHSLPQILSSEKARPFCSYQVREDSACAACPYLDYCNGGCIGMSFHHFGVFGMGDIRCPRLSTEL